MQFVSLNRVRRLGVLALLVMLAGQLVFLTHAVTADHGPGEICEICIGADRLSDGLLASSDTLALDAARTHAPALTASLVDTCFSCTVRSRSPPNLCSI